MFSAGCHFAKPAAFASLHGQPCCELPSLQRCFFPSKIAKRVERGHVVFPTMVVAQQTAAASPQLRIFHGHDLKGKDLQHVMARPRIDFESILHTVCNHCKLVDVVTLCSSADLNSQMSVQVQPIVQAVKDQGDAAVKQYTEKFDRVQLDTVCLPIEVSIHKTLTAISHHVLRSKSGDRLHQRLSLRVHTPTVHRAIVMKGACSAGFSRATASCRNCFCLSDCI